MKRKKMIIKANEVNSIFSISKRRLKNFKPDKKLSFALAKKDKIDFVYNTASLEGNPMTYPEVETLLEGITIGGHKLSDEQQILNQNKSVDLLLEMIEKDRFELSKEIFLELHNVVAKEEALEWGVFRNTMVNIGGTDYKPPKAEKLEQIFKEGLKEIEQIENPIAKGISFFLFGAKNQFFFDGNKRTSRLMMNGVMLKAGYPILNMKAKDKLEINKQMLDFYNKGDLSKALTYFIKYYQEENKHLAQSNKKGMAR